MLNVVVYCDGSSRPNPGYAGWGVHGYIYSEIISDKEKYIKIKDHYVTANGYKLDEDNALFVKPTHYFDLVGADTFPASNNRVEAIAVLKSISFILNNYTEVRSITLILDSQYTLRTINEYLEQWENNNWKTQSNKDPANLDIWLLIKDNLDIIKSKSIQLKVEWVKAHSNNFGNDRADKLSIIGSNMSYNNCNEANEKSDIYTDQEFRKRLELTNSHNLLNFKRIYFSGNNKYNIPEIYLLSDTKDEDTIGRKSSNVIYAIARLTQPYEVIDSIRNYYTSSVDASDYIVTLKLDRFFSKDIYPFIEKYGYHATILSKRYRTLSSLDEEALVYLVNPPMMFFKAIKYFNKLENLLRIYIQSVLNENQGSYEDIKFYDITSYFYNDTKNGKTLKPSISTVTKDIDITLDDNNYTLKILLGEDIPRRNQLKRLENSIFKVHLIVWFDSEYTLQLATAINCTEGILICSSFFSKRNYILQR